MSKTGIETAQVDLDVVRAIIEEAAKHLAPDKAEVLSGLLESHFALLRLLRERGTTIKRLRRLFGLSKTERLEAVAAKPDGDEEQVAPDSADDATRPADVADDSRGVDDPSRDEGTSEPEPVEPKRRTRTGGRRAAHEYAGPETVVPHPELQRGDPCTDCGRGKVYPTRPVVILVIRGRAPLEAEKFRLEALRCNACGAIFNADAPEDAKGPKYRASAVAILAALHYTFGMPFHRQDQLQKSLGVPVAASTQWKLMNEAELVLRPVYEALERHAAQSRVVHVDDTYLQLLQPSTGKLLRRKPEAVGAHRTGLFTTGILAVDKEDRRVALFVTGRQHAGENLVDLMKMRPPDLPPPIIMSDALSRNTSGLAGFMLAYYAHCLAHARRGVFDQVDNFPSESQHVLRELAKVFHNDRKTRDLGLSPRSRKAYHRKHSAPVLRRLRRWVRDLIDGKTVEPNSDMGKALNYILRHYSRLTLFLRQPDAPLTNNACERLLKLAIRYRKNSYFYRNGRGAEVGDLYMALTYTAMLNDKSPVHYLTALLEHPDDVANDPAAWLPWTYEATLASTEAADGLEAAA